jgi:hypothetical protein
MWFELLEHIKPGREVIAKAILAKAMALPTAAPDDGRSVLRYIPNTANEDIDIEAGKRAVARTRAVSQQHCETKSIKSVVTRRGGKWTV